MNVSQLIAKLKELKEIHGDVDVYVEVVSNYGEDFNDEEPILKFHEKAEYSTKTRFVRIT